MNTRQEAIRQMRRQHGPNIVGLIWQVVSAGYWVYTTRPQTIASVCETGHWGNVLVNWIEEITPDTH